MNLWSQAESLIKDDFEPSAKSIIEAESSQSASLASRSNDENKLKGSQRTALESRKFTDSQPACQGDFKKLQQSSSYDDKPCHDGSQTSNIGGSRDFHSGKRNNSNAPLGNLYAPNISSAGELPSQNTKTGAGDKLPESSKSIVLNFENQSGSKSVGLGNMTHEQESPQPKDLLSEVSADLLHGLLNSRPGGKHDMLDKSDGDSTAFSTQISASVLQQCKDSESFINQGLKLAETVAGITTTSDRLDPKQAKEINSPDAIIRETVQSPGKITENFDNIAQNSETSLIKESISFASGKIMGTSGGEMLQAAGGILSTSTLHLLKAEGAESGTGIKDPVKGNCQSAIPGSLSLSKISQAALNQTGLGGALETASEVIAVTEAMKNGDVRAILEDKHVQELGKKAFDISLEMATSAILTASGAKVVMAAASAASDVVAAAKEVKEMENNGKHGVTSFILETGAEIALKAALEGSGAGTALHIAAPILEPLGQKVVSEVAEHGAEFIDQAATNAGFGSIVKSSINAVIQLEETAASVVQSRARMVEEKLVTATFQTGEAVIQQTTRVVTDIVGSSDGCDGKNAKQQDILIDNVAEAIMDDGCSSVAVIEETFVQTASIYMKIKMLDKTTDVKSSNLLGSVTVNTVMCGAMHAISDGLTGRFEPIVAGLKMLEVLCRMGDSEGLSAINGLSTGAIKKTYELTKNGVLPAGKHRTLFDPDGDGIVHYSDTVQALAFLGLTGVMVELAVYNFHLMFSYPTSDGLLPRFKLRLPIQVKNMNRTAQGRNWGSLDRAKFIKKYAKSGRSGSTRGGNAWLAGPRGLQTLLFLFELGTMWPFRVEPDSKPEEISPIFKNAIIPVMVHHWALFQTAKSCNP